MHGGTGDPVLDWNEVALDALRVDRTQPGPVRAARNLAIVQAAVFDAVNGVAGDYEYYFVRRRARLGTSAEAAAVSAAYNSLRQLFPGQRGFFRAEYQESLAELPATVEVRRGLKYGRSVADRIVAWREFDGSDVEAAYEPGTRPGNWQPTGPGFQPAVHPGAGEIEPFAVDDSRQFLPPPPPDLDTQEYADAYHEVMALGERDSLVRTADQTEIGYFWAYDRAGLGTPVVLYNQVMQAVAVQEGNTMAENARLFALGNVAMADAGITAWECKYADNFWRPVSGVQNGDIDGNVATVGDPLWEPLGAPGGTGPNFTPPFPAYVSGHSTFGAACFGVLTDFYGTDAVSFSLTSDELPGVVRHYDRFSQASEENGRSRIYLGIHWSFDDVYGRQTGAQVANFVTDHDLTPLASIA